MYHECNLVHGDLSEYNILWHEDRPVIIDVSQSVEHAHPYANDFLRKDISNITDFFGKKGLRVLSNFELFQFVTDHFLLGPGRQFQGNSAEPEPIDSLKYSSDLYVKKLFRKFKFVIDFILLILNP